MIKCPKCGFENPEGSQKTCVACGAHLPVNQEPRYFRAPSACKPTTEAVSEDDRLTALAKRVKRATTYVMTFGENMGAVGTAFFIEYEGDTYIITNHHVIENAEDDGIVTLMFPEEILRGKDKFSASIMATDPLNDVALLNLFIPMPPGTERLELADMSTLAELQEVITVGNPHGIEFTATRGNISKVHFNVGKSPLSQILCSLGAGPGNSGGAVVRCSDGKVIGIATGIFPADHLQMETVCASADAVRQLICKYKYEKNNAKR